MRIAIYGAGSLGTVLGAYLTQAGEDVELINRNEAHVAALREKGACVTGSVSMQVPVKALLPQEMQGKYDLIILLTKQLYNKETAEFLAPYLGEDGVICTMQNGIPEPSVAQVIGDTRVCGCTVAWGATLLEAGVSELTSSPDSLSFGMGGMPSFPQEKLLEVKAVLEKMCPVELEENFMGVRWSKLLINAVFSGMGTVIGGTFGDTVDNKKARRCAQYALKECIDAGHAAGVTFAPVQGKDVVKLMDFSGRFKQRIAFMIMPLAMKKHRALKPSMLQDLEKGKQCEIGAINGVVCEVGRQHNVATPFNDKIVEIIRSCESGMRKPGLENLSLFDELLAKV